MGQRIIGLTGGIATGKTTVSQYLQSNYHLPVLDADVYAREAVQPGTALLERIVERYGDSILQASGELDRTKLGHIVFRDELEKVWLEKCIHPFVRQRFVEDMQRLASSPVVIQDIPLLFEANLTGQVTEIWVVVCSEPHQLERLKTRSSLPGPVAQARIQSQWPLDVKTARADVVLWNDTTLTHLYDQVDAAFRNGPTVPP